MDLLQGTLDLLVLKTLQAGPTHGWDIAQRIQQVSRDVLRVGQGSLYPALHRLEAGQLTRAQVLRAVAENETFTAREKNRAFVLMQYFGYLRRNPYDAPEPGLNFDGYNFWLSKLEEFNGNFIAAEMVKAFLTSTEYQQRFGPANFDLAH